MNDSSDDIDSVGAYLAPPPDDKDHPAKIASELLKLPEFADLVDGEAKIDWLLKRDTKVRGGRQILGTAHMPKVQGDLNPCFVWMLELVFKRQPDFLIILDGSYWFNPSQQPTEIPRLREILVYHELSHCIHKKDGFGDKRYDHDEKPVWGLKGHDVEEFIAVVQRYGAWTEEIRQFVDVVNAHHG